MKVKILVLTLFILFIPTKAQTLTGLIKSCNDLNFPRSDIQILSNESARPAKVLKSFQVDDNGRFKIVFDSPSYQLVRFCAVNHQDLEVPIYFSSENETIELEVVLAPVYLKEFSTVKVIGDFNNFEFYNNDVITMDETEDGSFTAVLEADAETLAFQLWGVGKDNHSVNHPIADNFILDEGGDYISVINTQKGSTVNLTVKREELPTADCEGKVTFKNRNTLPYFMYSLLEELNVRKDKFSKAWQEYYTGGGEPSDFKYDWTDDVNELNAMAEAAPEERKIYYKWAIVNLTYGEIFVDPDGLLNAFPPASSIWSINPTVLISVVLRVSSGNNFQILEKYVTQNKDETIKPYLLHELLLTADGFGRDDKVEYYYNIFTEKYSDSRFYDDVKSRFSPVRNIQSGKEVPGFTFASIDDSTHIITKNLLMGEIYLIDFWATWCGPCVGEMETLHNAYEKYKSQGFKIISISLDQKLEDVIKFRKEKWTMPWFNAFIAPNTNKQLLEDFELVAIPKPILIDKNGIIIAIEIDARGEKLDETLSGVFAD